MKRNISDGQLQLGALAVEIPSNQVLKKNYEIDLVEKQKELNEKIYKENNGWNHNLEYIAAQIGERASGLRWKHNKAVSYFNIRYQVLGILLILIQTGAATAAVTQISTCSTETNIVTVLVSIFMYLVAVTTSFKEFKNYGARTQCHRQAMTDFAGIEQNIRIELGKYRKDRKIGYDYTEWISNHFDSITYSSPSIPGYIQKQYKVHIQGQNLADADTINPIDIKGDSPPDKSSGSSPSPKNRAKSAPDLNAESAQNDTIDSQNNSNANTTTPITPTASQSAVSLEVKQPVVSDAPNGDTMIDFEPLLNKERQMYEIQRFLGSQEIM